MAGRLLWEQEYGSSILSIRTLHRLTQRRMHVIKSENFMVSAGFPELVRPLQGSSKSMSGWEDENENDSAGIKAMRKAFKEQGKQLAEMKEALAKTMEREKQNNVYEALANRGLDPRVAKFYPKDAPTDDTAVDEWVTENGELFGNRQVINNKEPNAGSLTDAEMRGYQIQRDISAYEGALQMDLKSRLDKIEYDPQNPEKAQNEVINTLKEFEGVINS